MWRAVANALLRRWQGKRVRKRSIRKRTNKSASSEANGGFRNPQTVFEVNKPVEARKPRRIRPVNFVAAVTCSCAVLFAHLLRGDRNGQRQVQSKYSQHRKLLRLHEFILFYDDTCQLALDSTNQRPILHSGQWQASNRDSILQ